MTSLSWVWVSPFAWALARWPGGCSVPPGGDERGHGEKLRSRGESSVGSQMSTEEDVGGERHELGSEVAEHLLCTGRLGHAVFS